MKGYVFPVDRLKLCRVYESELVKSFKKHILESEKIERVYGELLFPSIKEPRPYTYGSFVSSVDGKIAFPESPDGTLIAKNNFYDPDGALCDFWMLNMLRSVSDALIMGANAIRREPTLRGIIFDDELLRDRTASGYPPVPLNVIVTGSGDIPLNHRVVVSDSIPLLIATSPFGRERLIENFREVGSSYRDYGCFCLPRLRPIRKLDKSAPLSIIAVGQNDSLDIKLLLELLRQGGIEMLLVESPSFLVSLMREKLLDEIFLNLSGIFIGGDALSIGSGSLPFGVTNHPHTRVLTIHVHSDYFFYFRYRLHYD